MRRFLSGSAYWHALLCAYAYRPDVECPERPSGEAARIGIAGHSLVAEAFGGPAHVETDRDLEAHPIARQAIKWLNKQDRKPNGVEVAIVYNAFTDTAREVKGAGHREYGPLASGDIPTTLDLVWIEADRVTVRDLKTGSKGHAHREQLEIQALAASRLYDRPFAEHGFLWARKTKCDSDELTEMGPSELEGESWRAASVMRRLPMAQPQPGQHCWLCPLGMDRCPAHSGEAERRENG